MLNTPGHTVEPVKNRVHLIYTEKSMEISKQWKLCFYAYIFIILEIS